MNVDLKAAANWGVNGLGFSGIFRWLLTGSTVRRKAWAPNAYVRRDGEDFTLVHQDGTESKMFSPTGLNSHDLLENDWEITYIKDGVAQRAA